MVKEQILTDEEKSAIDRVRLTNVGFNLNNPSLTQYIERYESDPERYGAGNGKVRYRLARLGMTFGEAERKLGLAGGSIAGAANGRYRKVDAIISRLIDVPVDQLRNVKPTKKTRLDNIDNDLHEAAMTLHEIGQQLERIRRSLK